MSRIDSRLAHREARRLNKLRDSDLGHFEMRPRDPREILAKIMPPPSLVCCASCKKRPVHADCANRYCAFRDLRSISPSIGAGKP